MASKINYDSLVQLAQIHGIYRAFCKYMSRWYYKLQPGIRKDHSPSKRKYRVFDPSQMMGYMAMQRVKSFIARNPRTVQTVTVDDNVFAGSMLILVPHPKMGISVFFIPQCTNERGVFFLYPHHLKELTQELAAMKKAFKLK